MADRICTEPACERETVGRGLCAFHHTRWRRAQIVVEDLPRCSVDGCAKPRSVRGLCDMHYRRAKRAGEIPPPPKTVEGRFLASIRKAENGCWVWTKRCQDSGYSQFVPYGRPVLAHRFAYEFFVGPIPDGLELDHVCHTHDASCPGGPACLHRRCVNPDHLEPVTPLENKRRSRRRVAA